MLRKLFAFTTYETTKARLQVCDECEHAVKADVDKCGLCGCFLFLKVRVRRQTCPIGRW